MIKKIGQRLLHFCTVLLGVSLLTFFIGHLAPGDPVLTYLDMGLKEPSQELIEETRKELGLDRPLIIQYTHWVKDAIKLDFGNSYQSGKPVIEELKVRLPATLELAGCIMLVTLGITIPFGVLVGMSHGKWYGKFLDTGVLLLMAIPAFCIGLFFIYVFGVKLKWLPVMGRGSMKQLILPVLTMSLGISGSMIRLIRSEIIEAVEQDYVYSALGLGIPYRRVVLWYILKPISISILTRLGMVCGSILGGSAIIETLFAWPGIGSLLVEAVGARDYPVIQCYTLLIALMYLLVNALIDFLCTLIDPRIRLGGDKNRE